MCVLVAEIERTAREIRARAARGAGAGEGTADAAAMSACIGRLYSGLRVNPSAKARAIRRDERMSVRVRSNRYSGVRYRLSIAPRCDLRCACQLRCHAAFRHRASRSRTAHTHSVEMPGGGGGGAVYPSTQGATLYPAQGPTYPASSARRPRSDPAPRSWCSATVMSRWLRAGRAHDDERARTLRWARVRGGAEVERGARAVMTRDEGCRGAVWVEDGASLLRSVYVVDGMYREELAVTCVYFRFLYFYRTLRPRPCLAFSSRSRRLSALRPPPSPYYICLPVVVLLLPFRFFVRLLSIGNVALTHCAAGRASVDGARAIGGRRCLFVRGLLRHAVLCGGANAGSGGGWMGAGAMSYGGRVVRCVGEEPHTTYADADTSRRTTVAACAPALAEPAVQLVLHRRSAGTRGSVGTAGLNLRAGVALGDRER
ncbi:hypothetical protein DFH09DRAFT_1147547 [Mycena vulgaris]|nr:hypothetical protein DFH09DRAFT_1147547 [Mycena vulgaris]